MTLEQLRIFVAVAEQEHVTKASRALNLTQSATSAAIAALEARHGVRLFDRVGRSIVLTKIGKAFLEDARAVLARAQAAHIALGDLAGLRQGAVTVAVSQTVASYWLPSRLNAFCKAYPGVTTHVRIGNTEQTVAAIRERAADLGIVEGPVRDRALTVSAIPGDNLIVVAAPKHRWAGLTRLSPRALPTADWVLREPGSGTRSMFEQALIRLGLSIDALPVRLELSSNEAIRAVVEQGDMVTAISDLVVGPALEAGTLRHIKLALPRRPFFVLRHKDRYVSDMEKALMRSFGLKTAG